MEIIQAMSVSSRPASDPFNPYRQLACEVINTALADLTAYKRNDWTMKRVIDFPERRRAQEFLEDPILEMWSEAAGVHVDRIRKKAAEIIARRDGGEGSPRLAGDVPLLCQLHTQR